MSSKILITGSGGFVGKNLYQTLKQDFEILGIGKCKKECVDKKLDVTDKKLLNEELNKFNPDVIVHLAALSNVEKCEVEKEFANEQNVSSIKNLVNWAQEKNKKVIYVSSDYVFDGIKGDFDENDKEHPIQYYGQTKLAGEKIVSSLKKYLILRPTVIYGWDLGGMNFLMQLYRNQKEGKEMKIPMDQISNPTYVLDLCDLIKKTIESDRYGTFISTGDEIFNRFDLALKICECMDWNKDLLIPVETKSLGQVAKRPLNNSTCNTRVKKSFDFEFHGLEENLKALKSRFV